MSERAAQKYMRQAYQIATQSPDQSTQNGAVIVGRDGWAISAPNTFPSGVEHRHERPEKYAYIEHAERNVIYACAFDGFSTAGTTMYVLWAACADCARGIIQSGVTTVVTHNFYLEPPGMDEAGRKNWAESIKDAMVMFEEAGVRVVYTDVEVMKDGETLRFNGQEVSF